MRFHEIPWRIQASGALGILGVPSEECFASGETCFQSCGELDPVQLQPDPLQPLQPLVATWRTREVLVLLQILFPSLWKPGGFNMARMMMTQIYTECTCYSWIGKHIHRFCLHNFFMYHKYIHTYRIITAGTVGVLRSARHGLVKQAASPPYGWF